MNKNQKTIFSPRYKSFIREIVDIRHKKGLSQAALAKLSNRSTNFIGRVEICDRRLDILESIDLLKAMGLSESEIIKVIKKLF